MNTGQVDKMLSSYKACLARRGHLKNEVTIAERQLRFLDENAMYLETLRAQQYDSTPHGTDVHSPVESLIIKFDDGYTPKYIKDLHQDFAQVSQELFEIERVVSFVDSWLLVLTERERFVVQRHIIDGCFWKDVLDEYEAKWGIFSKEGLRKLKKKALNRIYEAAE